MANAATPALAPTAKWKWAIGPGLALGVGAITALAAILDLHAIGGKPLWFDEGMSLGCARLSWGDSAMLALHEPVQWPYYLALRFFLLFGNSETVIRLPSALFMIGCIPLMFLLSRRLFGDMAGFVSASLLAVNAEMVKYAQEARSYAMEVFLIVASGYVLCDYVKEPNRKNQLLYILLCTLAVYTHMYAVLVVLAQGLSVLVFPSKEVPRTRWLQTYFSIFILTIPMWLFIAQIPRYETYFIPPLSLAYVYSVLNQISGQSGGLGVVLYGWIVLVAAVRAVSLARSVGRTKETWAVALAALWAALPMLITIAAHASGRPFLLERYMLICIPGVALAAGALVAAVPHPRMALIVAVVIVAIGVLGVRNFFQLDYARSPEDYPKLAKFIAANAQAGDGIVFFWQRMQVLYKHYSDQLPGEFDRPEIIYPLPGSVGQLQILAKGWQAAPPIALQGHRRVWLVLHNMAQRRGDAEIGILKQTIQAQFRVEAIRQLPTWTVILYSRP